MGISDIEKYGHHLHSKTSAYKRKVERAYSSINDALRLNVNFYCAFSGGSDSQVVLDMLYSRGVRCDILFGDDGFDFLETLDFLKSTEQNYDFHLRRIRSMNPWRDWCIEMSRPDLASDPAALEAWGNPRQWDDTWHSLTRDAPTHGYDGVFLGMLASESRSRSYQLQDGWRSLYRVKSEGGMWHCSPLASWTKQDVWAWIVEHDVPYNPVYDRLAELGVPLAQRRVAALTCFRVLQFGSHALALKVGWPTLYNHLAATFPRVREYA